MTAHELAKLLMAGPDITVVVVACEDEPFEIQAADVEDLSYWDVDLHWHDDADVIGIR